MVSNNWGLLTFKHMIFIPVSIYVGQFNTHESINCLLFQFLWLILLFSIVRIVWMLSIRKITIFEVNNLFKKL